MSHILTGLLKPEELDEWQLRWKEDEESVNRFLCMDVVAAGGQYMGSLYEEASSYSPEVGLDVFADPLEDFITPAGSSAGR